MHLEVNQRLQEVASFKRDKFFPEEIDMALNKAMFRLLEDAVVNKFEDTQIRLGHVSALLQKNRIVDAIIPSTSDPVYQPEFSTVYSTVPADFYWLVNLRAEVVSDKVNCKTAPVLGNVALTENIVVVKFPSPKAVSPFYDTLTVTSTDQGTLYTAPTPLRNITNANTKSDLVRNIIETLQTTNLRVYYESYRERFEADSLIFVSNSTLGTITITGGLATTSGTNSQVVYATANRGTISTLPNAVVKVIQAKNHEQDDIYSALTANYFYKPDSIELSMEQTFDYFIVYHEKSSLVTRLMYDYIRKPKSISLLLGQNCELSETTHYKIIDLAVEILRLDTKDQNYPQTTQDIQLRTN